MDIQAIRMFFSRILLEPFLGDLFWQNLNPIELPFNQLLREASQEQDVAGGAREAAHGREALPLLHLRGRVRLQQRPRAAHAGRPQDRGQGGHDGLEPQREAEMNNKPLTNP